MSIHEQAKQLAALTEESPQGQAQAIISTLRDVQHQVVNMLGDTSSSQELQGNFNAVISEVEQAAADGLEHLTQQITITAHYHQS